MFFILFYCVFDNLPALGYDFLLDYGLLCAFLADCDIWVINNRGFGGVLDDLQTKFALDQGWLKFLRKISVAQEAQLHPIVELIIQSRVVLPSTSQTEMLEES